MITDYFEDIDYEEFNGFTSSGQPIYKEATKVKALRLRGNRTIYHNASGDTISDSTKYKTNQYIMPMSRFNGREVDDCVKVPAFGHDCGYMVYLK